jgi:phage N-6-adenine-methyltransferase
LLRFRALEFMPRRRLHSTNADRQAAYRERRRKRQPVYHWHKSDEWETPPDLFAALDREFHFTIDLAALPHNAKCADFISPGEDALTRKWEGVCWLNPPYGAKLARWMKKAHDSAQAGAVVVCLLPARTDTQWWHDYVMPYAEIRYIRGRVKFNGIINSAPFPSVIAVFRARALNPSFELSPYFSSDSRQNGTNC